ncbi:acylneuraminate cytidylyltransferase family protein [bacterium]|nr:acylneuraminate cytidylyltransferase family protein [bacterium]
MAQPHPILAVIPARGGSKGLPGKNLKILGDIPLIGHAIKLAQSITDIAQVIVSTDSPEIAAAANALGAETPFFRPPILATDTAPMWPVIQHALSSAREHYGVDYQSILLLDPTALGRTPLDIISAIQTLTDDESADGVISVSEYEHNPLWYAVHQPNGYMQDLCPEGKTYTRRQDLPPVYRINGQYYLWRSTFVQSTDNWRISDKLIPSPMSNPNLALIDTPEDFNRAEELVSLNLLWSPK